MFRTGPLSIIESFSLYAQQWCMSYRFADSFRAGSGRSVLILFVVQCWSCSQAVSKPVWHTSLLCVQWKTLDGGQRNCPKHVEFYSKNKFERLVLTVSFILRIYHNARSPERQILKIIYTISAKISVRRQFNYIICSQKSGVIKTNSGRRLTANNKPVNGPIIIIYLKQCVGVYERYLRQ